MANQLLFDYQSKKFKRWILTTIYTYNFKYLIYINA